MKKLIIFALFFSGAAFAESSWYTVSTEELAQLGNKELSSRVVERGQELSIISLNIDEVLKLSELVHEKLNKCGGFKAHDNLENAHVAIKNYNSKLIQKDPPNYTISQQEKVLPRIDLVSEFNLTNTITQLSNFHSRYCYSDHGNTSSLYIKDLWADLTKERTDAKVEVIYHNNIKQPTIVLTITGTTKPNEIVVLGGHADSISYGGAVPRSPGADDNASGIASITEVIRILVDSNFKPERTIQFMAYAAEEVGLKGSGIIARNYKKDSKNVIGVMQLDMTIFKGTADSDIVLINDETNPALNAFTATMIDTYVKVPWKYSPCGYACSDHASWTDNGYPSTFPFESTLNESNKKIHSANDTLENAGGNSLHAVNFSKLAIAFVIEMAQ